MADAKIDNGLAAKIRGLEEKIDKITKILERLFGIDINKDGKVGRASVGFLIGVLTVFATVGILIGANETVWNIRNTANTADVYKVDAEGDVTANSLSLTTPLTDANVADSLTVAAAGLTGNIALARLTNATTTAYQPLDSDLTDLADGSLTGSKVGTGIPGGNITTGNIPLAQLTNATAAVYQPLDSDLTDLADGSLTGSKVGTGIPGGNITTGNIPLAQLTNATAAVYQPLDADLTGLAGKTIKYLTLTNLVYNGGTTTGNVNIVSW